jgi:hypothetical protein
VFVGLHPSSADPSEKEGIESKEKKMSTCEAKRFQNRIVIPIPSWNARQAWGEDLFPIEEWFDEGEALAHSDAEVFIDEPDRWERAMDWMRSLALASGLISL